MAQGTVCNVDGRDRHLGQTTQSRPLRPDTAQRGVAQCVRTAGSAEPAASRPRMVIGWGQTRPDTAQRGVAQCVRTAGSAEPAASRPRMVIGLAVVVDMCGRLNMSMCVWCVVCVCCVCGVARKSVL